MLNVWTSTETKQASSDIARIGEEEIIDKNSNNKPWIFIGRTNAEAEAPILWPPDAKNWLFGKDPVSGKDWRQEKGTTEDKMVGWHHSLDGHEFE